MQPKKAAGGQRTGTGCTLRKSLFESSERNAKGERTGPAKGLRCAHKSKSWGWTLARGERKRKSRHVEILMIGGGGGGGGGARKKEVGSEGILFGGRGGGND